MLRFTTPVDVAVELRPPEPPDGMIGALLINRASISRPGMGPLT